MLLFFVHIKATEQFSGCILYFSHLCNLMWQKLDLFHHNWENNSSKSLSKNIQIEHAKLLIQFNSLRYQTFTKINLHFYINWVKVKFIWRSRLKVTTQLYQHTFTMTMINRATYYCLIILSSQSNCKFRKPFSQSILCF